MGSITIKNVKCEILPVEAIPEIWHQEITSPYAQVVESFMRGAAPMALLSADWPGSTTNGDLEAVRQGINNCARKMGAEMYAVKRQWEIYLVKGARVEYRHVEPLPGGAQ